MKEMLASGALRRTRKMALIAVSEETLKIMSAIAEAQIAEEHGSVLWEVESQAYPGGIVSDEEDVALGRDVTFLARLATVVLLARGLRFDDPTPLYLRVVDRG